MGDSDRATSFVVNVVNRAQLVERPFHHIVFDHFFPDHVYQQILEAMPVESDYRPMSGRAKDYGMGPGGPSRVKIDLFPEYIRLLPQPKRAVWDVIGRFCVRKNCRRHSCGVSRPTSNSVSVTITPTSVCFR